MSHESKQACQRIVALCEQSNTLNSLQLRIYDVALEGLGYLSGQRKEITDPWRQKIIQTRRDRQQARWDAERAASFPLELVA